VVLPPVERHEEAGADQFVAVPREGLFADEDALVFRLVLGDQTGTGWSL
jgi:hypothetical protein